MREGGERRIKLLNTIRLYHSRTHHEIQSESRVSPCLTKLSPRGQGTE